MVFKRDDFPVSFNVARCKKCGVCSHFCPGQAIAFDNNGYPCAKAPEKCTRCYTCFHRCPDFAVEVKDNDQHAVSAG
ncbi:4Fe-4S dicluster domain-containing protein [Desulfoscipio geothermicus]|uniref:2-oxoglutarate ferredoxin oxidoreductase subunit delta n=1 Tax=Desulfoscipio geothermicus DSM 3669 TaxID=1121426 RepID=A0A1I6D496_9FIRM|nr:2-oxoglutarate ferredoxin oxidoreductase subunit delta [Desulfoscipio geothermicus DSM 3669]